MIFIQCIILLCSLIHSAPTSKSAKDSLRKGPTAVLLPKINHIIHKPVHWRQDASANVAIQSIKVRPLHHPLAALPSSSIGDRQWELWNKNNIPETTASLKGKSVINSKPASVTDLASPPGSPDVTLNDISSVKEPFDHSKKFQELEELIENNDQDAALLKSLEFDGHSRKIILNYVFSTEQWGLTRRMLENGFDPSELLKTLNILPPEVALEMVNKIGHYGIYKYRNGYRFIRLKKESSTTPAHDVKYDQYRFFRSISPDLKIALAAVHPHVANILENIQYKGYSYGTRDLVDQKQKAIVLAFMVADKKWDLAKKMISKGYDQEVLERLLAQYPDMAAIQVYESILSSYIDFEKSVTTEPFYKDLNDIS